MDLLKNELLWRVGNGRKIKIWNDRWIPIPLRYKIQSLVKRLVNETRVEELIQEDNDC